MGAEFNLRILIFEDNTFIRCALEDLLSELGHKVFSFQDPIASPLYEKSYCGCPSGNACADIIISDINMPFVSGLDFMKRQIQKGCRVKCWALMSGDWTDSGLQCALNFECQIFHKPFNIRDLFQWIDRCQQRIEPSRKLSDWTGREEPLSAPAGLTNKSVKCADFTTGRIRP